MTSPSTALDLLADPDLIIRIAAGDHQAFTMLVNRHAEHYYRLAWRLLHHGENAADIVQEAFLRLWQHPERYDGHRGSSFTTWFYRVVVNLCIDQQRKKKPEALEESYQPIAAGVNPEKLVAERQCHDCLAMMIQTLPVRQKAAMTLCFYEELSNQEAADIMGISLKALQSLLVRAKNALRQQYVAPEGGMGDHDEC
ncbi:MAG: sigma-70 family RNA polymerase sigma factor [Deltaproteobacteria bacterium]|nr:sigma-70 family RNA polymerase sigma factor [Candidatus Anaeroferrophillus wilburensis]MBN2888706.1 sigma-70 family RNA polymerase sigma factor [Deltaproteobacteria bacterium]